MIRYSIGGFYTHRHLLDVLWSFTQVKPEWFREGVVFDSTFDSFPNVLWNGGRFCFDLPLSVEHMKKVIAHYNGRGIGVRYTYTNLLLEKKHLYDPLGNITLVLAHDPMNAVITATPVLEAHVRRHYPKFKLVGSCTPNKLATDALSVRADQVDILVLPPDLNHRHDLIEDLGPKRLEILVNERCQPMCPSRSKHYQIISQQVLDQSTPSMHNPHLHLPGDCVFRQGTPAWHKRNSEGCFPMHLDFARVQELHALGVENFKIGGRDLHPTTLLEDIAEHLVREEFQYEFYRAMSHSPHLRNASRAQGLRA